MKAQGTVAAAMGVTALSITLASIARGKPPTFRPIVGVFVAGGILLVAAQADSTDEVAVKLATLVAVTAVFTTGGIVANALGTYFSR